MQNGSLAVHANTPSVGNRQSGDLGTMVTTAKRAWYKYCFFYLLPPFMHIQHAQVGPQDALLSP